MYLMRTSSKETNKKINEVVKCKLFNYENNELIATPKLEEVEDLYSGEICLYKDQQYYVESININTSCTDKHLTICAYLIKL